jgi:cytosine/adenosine deaminase-related metal-dependent hydrolase
MRRGTLSLGARYVFPVEGPPIPNGVVTIEEGRIGWIGPAREHGVDVDLGNVAITPGLVNAHTHLELSRLASDEDAGDAVEVQDEIAWLSRVIDQRRTNSEAKLRDAVARNVQASLAAGTTLVADTTTAGLSWEEVAAAPIRAVVFAEIIGLKRYRGLESNNDAWKWLSSITHESQVAACA